MTDPVQDAMRNQQQQENLMPPSDAQQYSLTRRILFPFSAEEPLSAAQSLRVMVGWIALFAPGVVLLTLIAGLLASASLPRLLFLLVLAALFGVFIFGLAAWFAVSMNNRAARIVQARKAARTTRTTTRGGRYGS